MIWFIQILAIQFAISLAKHDAPAVSQFEHYGLANKQMARFHRYGWWAKLLFCLVAAIIPAQWPNTDLLAIAVRGLMAGLWVYLVFDPALNLCRSPRRKLLYLGLNDADGRFWNGTFGRHAGVWKVIVLGVVIAGINFLNHFL